MTIADNSINLLNFTLGVCILVTPIINFRSIFASPEVELGSIIIYGIYLEVGWVELLGQHAERFGVPSEVANVEDGLRVRQIVLLEVVIETGPGTAEIRDPRSCQMCVCVL